MNQRQFDAAQSAFEALGEYKDSVGMLEECKYGKALALSQGGELETACGLFRALGDYKDCQQQISQILKQAPQLAQLGDHYFFGLYEQDNNLENGAEEIEWQIINIADDQLELQAVYLLDSQPYHNSTEKVS